MIPKSKIYQLKINNWLRVRHPFPDGSDVTVKEVRVVGELKHNDNFIFLEVAAASEDEARKIFNENKREIVQYLWRTTAITTADDVERFIEEITNG
jgi:hypothetical protein